MHAAEYTICVSDGDPRFLLPTTHSMVELPSCHRRGKGPRSIYGGCSTGLVAMVEAPSPHMTHVVLVWGVDGGLPLRMPVL